MYFLFFSLSLFAAVCICVDECVSTYSVSLLPERGTHRHQFCGIISAHCFTLFVCFVFCSCFFFHPPPTLSALSFICSIKWRCYLYYYCYYYYYWFLLLLLFTTPFSSSFIPPFLHPFSFPSTNIELQLCFSHGRQF
ncbi:hypothetical protein, unlikely [Trypanosoma brucei gambiense DAL972]|uniref:T. brucei spp.-specific protein n=1 Tax=Trypanosoma brucei gambiense (strain MHOM/CI/86/DAL972) TaxID=679716 RepID=D0A9B8_TRYB9|nr:hypothetical protein, unlikely [Trypanosoma brucei gambiense DAL972]CBH18269.1 hypothetical protein, unlikely [Trypanosoma brucei gambiense DAL972]|eukprot:XP_011780533.1 hypothetical protein, unlikely [Trypanosoma brucei gambiense DAL972]